MDDDYVEPTVHGLMDLHEGSVYWSARMLFWNANAIHKLLLLLTILSALYVVTRATISVVRRSPLPIARFVILSFLPLLINSISVYFSVMVIHSHYFAKGLADPWALPQHLAFMRLSLYAAWTCTALSLTAVFLANRIKAN